ncbi:CGNR zinc finger domain-containing protein [Streptomyces alanosinicus]|uniref:Zinc finger CGNR domain-containing protein n=1 Tax=Streptomyces alanosinicus TaxID=68171 RepID=A0A919D782_9ACTN|nr:CGNR zinc finger domain-containing protein [Streptomyces alanosinicus]GHE10280.1 hypothetical protein GCM10010339_65830 [Streptomyces alanosinicus]
MPQYNDPRPLPAEPLALDLVNTRYTDPRGHHDLINTRAALNRWLHTSPALTHYPDIYRLSDEYAFTIIRDARDSLARLLARPGDPAALERFNRLLVHGRTRRELTPAGITHHLDIDDPAHLLGYLAADNYVSLITEKSHRLHACANACGLYFLDTSRNGTRRWCSHDRCGNRVRAARHYARSKIRT